MVAEHFDESQIQLDGTRLPCIWNDIYNTVDDAIVGYGCTYAVSGGNHIVSHTGKAGRLSVVIYGWSDRPSLGYAYLPGLEFQTAEQPTGR